jgi:hypothetical protein
MGKMLTFTGVPKVIRSPAVLLSMTGSIGARSTPRYLSKSSSSSSSFLASRASSASSSGSDALRLLLGGKFSLPLCCL